MKKEIDAEVLNYFLKYDEKIQKRFKQIRKLIYKHKLEIEECISYKMPCYKYNGKPILYFAGYVKHIGVYALPNAHKNFKDALSHYKQGKGSVQFPHDVPLPEDLIASMIEFNINQKK